jgi:hypothetical protein
MGARAKVGPGRSRLSPAEDDQPCHSCTTQGTRSSGTRQGQYFKRNLDRTDVPEETSGTTDMQQWNKGPRLKGAATCKKREDIRQDFQEGSSAGDREPKF